MTIIYHEVVPDGSPVCTDPETVTPCLDPYSTTVSQFQAQLDYIEASGLSTSVMPVSDAFAAATGKAVNGIPTTGAVNFSPAELRMQTPAVQAVTTGFSDPDKDTLTFHYTWTIDGTPVAGATGATLDLSARHLTRGQQVGVKVYADDGHKHWTATRTQAATVVNAPPTGGTLDVQPPVNGTLTANATGYSDPDGDTVTPVFAWYRNGVKLAATGATLSTAGFAAGEVIKVEARGDDGHGAATAPLTAEVKLTEVPPAATATPAPTVTPPPDRAAPKIAITVPRAAKYKLRRKLTLRFTCTDPSGLRRLSATLHRVGGSTKTVKSGSRVTLTRTGRYVLRVSATDKLGNTAVRTVTFRVTR